MRINLKNFFSYYILHINAKELTPQEKRVARVASISLGIFTFALSHLFCRLFFYNRKYTLKNSKDEPKISDIASGRLFPCETEESILPTDSNESLQKKFSDAVEFGSELEVKWMLEDGFPVSGDQGLPYLLQAIEFSDLEIIALLLKHGVTVNPKTKTTPLGRALIKCPHAARLLLKHGANPNQQSDGKTLYQIANQSTENTDDHYPLYLHQLLYQYGTTIKPGDIQANKGFTFLYLHLIKEGREEEAKKLDKCVNGGLLANSKRLMLAHRFAIQGRDPQGFQYIGFWPDFTYPELISSLRSFCSEKGREFPIEKDIINSTIKALSSVEGPLKSNELYARYQSNDFVIVPTGYERHSTATVIKGNKIAHCNKGAGRGDQAIFFFEKENDKLLEKDFFDKALYSQNHFSNTTIIPSLSNYDQKQLLKSKLGKQFFPSIDHEHKGYDSKDQKAGNCTWASAKLALRACLHMAIEEKYPDRSHDQIKKEVNEFFKAWRLFDLQKSLDDYVDFCNISETSNENKDTYLLQKIQKKCEKKESQGKVGYAEMHNKVLSYLSL